MSVFVITATEKGRFVDRIEKFSTPSTKRLSRSEFIVLCHWYHTTILSYQYHTT